VYVCVCVCVCVSGSVYECVCVYVRALGDLREKWHVLDKRCTNSHFQRF
jgi:hypothetical protein